MKLYNKRGNKNYKEKRLLKEIEESLSEKLKNNPNFQNEVIPATNYDELQKMHEKYVGFDEADVIEIKDKNKPKENKNMSKKTTEEFADVEFEETPVEAKSESKSSTFIDPFNREEPIVRDYVLGDNSFRKTEMTSEQAAKTVFDEPTSFQEAFVIPDDDEELQEEPKSAPKQTFNASGREAKRREPINPNFEEMNSGKQKKSTQKFAKYIVEAVSVVSEKGFVWFANKDINDAKLAEYEMTENMDLSILVTLDTGQDVTVKQFFQSQCVKAEELAQWTTEQKNDLSIALAEVLLEKGIAPTPTQELILVAATIIGGQAMTLMTLKSQTSSLLSQLRMMNDGAAPREYQQTYSEPPLRENSVQQENNETTIEDLSKEVISESDVSEIQFSNIDDLTEEELLMSNEPIQTKE